jgi:hypothetical protein
MQSPKRVCIHIGTDKAGSTAIQAFAFRNRAVLAERGLQSSRAGSSTTDRSTATCRRAAPSA